MPAPHALPTAGGAGPIVFSHANSFPAGTYRVLFDAWRAAGHTVHAIERFGHDPKYPVSTNWPHLRNQLIDFIDAEVAQPAFLVGHSLGGLLSLLAACKRPDLARGLVLLDAPVITGWRAHSLQVMRATGLMQRISPGRVSARRRHEWPTRADVLPHFARKRMFAGWDSRVLEDYVHAGFEDRADCTVLAFEREVETRIYETLPNRLGCVLRKHPPRRPVGFIAGTRSVEMRRGGVAASKALARQHFVWIDGTHLYPMEKPDQTAAEVLRLIGSFGGPADISR
jgi:pimeloyl-ACP methyl ester carboxylesterase